MPRITLPKREVFQTGNTGAVPIDPGASRYVNEEVARVGETLGRVGGAFGDLALRAMQIDIQNQFTDAQNEYNKQMGDELINIRQDPNIMSWPVKMREAHERVSEYLTAREEMLPAAKNRFNQWSTAMWNRERVRVTLESMDTIAKKQVTELPDKMMSYIRSDDREGFVQHLTEMNDANNLPETIPYWLQRYDENMHFERVRLQLEKGNIDAANTYIKNFVKSSEVREKLSAKVEADEARISRERERARIQMQETTQAKLMVGIWDNEGEVDEQLINDALSLGYIDTSQAQNLRRELFNPNVRTNSDPMAVMAIEESLMSLRRGIGNRRDVYSAIMANMKGLKPEDGKAYIKEAADAEETFEARWDKEAWDYIGKQFLHWDPITESLTGSAKQFALAAQARILYSQARKQAMQSGEPWQGPEHLSEAHKIVMPFRAEHKSLFPALDKMSGEFPSVLTIPQTKGRFVPILNEFTRRTLGLPSRMLPKPNSVEEFESTIKSLPDFNDRKWYYNKYAEEIYD